MPGVFRRRSRRAYRLPKYYTKKVSSGTAANTISPFTSAASGDRGSVGVAADTIAALASSASGDRGSVGSSSSTISPFTSAADGDLGLVGRGANVIDLFTSVASGQSYALDFVPGVTIGTTDPTLQSVIPSYLYKEYTDDDDLQAFVAAYNSIAQEYVAWMNAVGLPVYTGATIAGDLLDWVALGLYGVRRPALSAGAVHAVGPFNTLTGDSKYFNYFHLVGPSVFTLVNDDIFKRVLTWRLYKGDGKQINVRWLKRRVLRFLTGANGTDVSVADTQQISVTFGGNTIEITTVTASEVSTAEGFLYNAIPFNEGAFNGSNPGTRPVQTLAVYQRDNQVNINFLSQIVTSVTGATFNSFQGNTLAFNAYAPGSVRTFSPLPNTAVFKQAADQGVLDLPFQFKFVVNIL